MINERLCSKMVQDLLWRNPCDEGVEPSPRLEVFKTSDTPKQTFHEEVFGNL